MAVSARKRIIQVRADDPHISEFVDEHLNGDVSDCDLISDDENMLDPSFNPQDLASSSSSSDVP